EVALCIGVKLGNVVASESLRGMDVVFDVMKCLAVESAQPVFGSDPDKASTVLRNAVDIIKDKSFLAGVVVWNAHGGWGRFDRAKRLGEEDKRDDELSPHGLVFNNKLNQIIEESYFTVHGGIRF